MQKRVSVHPHEQPPHSPWRKSASFVWICCQVDWEPSPSCGACSDICCSEMREEQSGGALIS